MFADQPKALLNKVQSAILIVEPDTTLRFFNKRAADLLGLERNAANLHRTFWTWMEHDPTGLERILEDPRNRLEVDVIYPLPEGEPCYLHVTFSHFEDELLMATCWPHPALATRAEAAGAAAPPDRSSPTGIAADPRAKPPFDAVGSAVAHLGCGLEGDIASLSVLWEAFPCEALVIDDHYRILRRNKRSLAKRPEASTCHAYRGLEEPCPNCPATLGFSTTLERTLGHSGQGTYVTETFAPVYGGQGAILTFEDHTGKVELLHSIKAQRAKIKERSVTLARLLATLNKMRVGLKPLEVVRYAIRNLRTESQAVGVVLLVEDEKRHGLWLKEQDGLDGWVLDVLAAGYQSLRRLDQTREIVLPESLLPWPLGEVRQATMTDRDKTQFGLLLVAQPQVENAEFIFSLFFISLNNYLHERSLSRKLAVMANTDELTGSFNRAYIDRRLIELVARWDQEGVPFAVVLADANGLKRVNDQHGHKAGDALIREAARALKQCAGVDDLVGRLGGDEFGVLLPGANQALADRYIQRVCDFTAQQRLADLDLPVSLSLGAASIEWAPAPELFKRADEAMYAMKQRYYEMHQKYR